MKTSLIIPAYNEEDRLGPFLESVKQYHRQWPESIDEILVVDDGSTDNTSGIARQYQQEIPLQVIVHTNNRGKGAAVQTGVMAATGEHIIFIDADGATDIDQLPKMIKALTKAQVGIGNRWLAESETERSSYLRRLAGWVYRTYLRLFGLGGIDTMCGFKGYHRSVARSLFGNLIEERWLFDTEIAYKAVRAGYTIENFPITWESKDGSKLDTKTLIKTAFQIWPLIQTIKKAEG